MAGQPRMEASGACDRYLGRNIHNMYAYDISREDQIWEIYRSQLEEYVRREGHCEVPAGHMEDGLALGKWVEQQRSRREHLTENQRRFLRGLKNWNWKTPENSKQRIPRKQSALRKQNSAGNGRGRQREQQDNDKFRHSELVQPVWKALLGRGQITEKMAVRHAASALYDSGLVKEYCPSEDRPLYRVFLQCFKEGVELGIMDRPRAGYIRAILKRPEKYKDGHWDMCVRHNTAKTPREINLVISKAAAWAKKMMGLEFKDVEPGDVIHESLSNAIIRAICDGTLTHLNSGEVLRTAS